MLHLAWLTVNGEQVHRITCLLNWDREGLFSAACVSSVNLNLLCAGIWGNDRGKNPSQVSYQGDQAARGPSGCLKAPYSAVHTQPLFSLYRLLEQDRPSQERTNFLTTSSDCSHCKRWQNSAKMTGYSYATTSKPGGHTRQTTFLSTPNIQR